MECLVGYSSSTSSREESASLLVSPTIVMVQDSRQTTMQNTQMDPMETLPPLDTMQNSQPETMDTSLTDTIGTSPSEMKEAPHFDINVSPLSSAPVFAVQISLQNAVEVEFRGNDAGVAVPHPSSSMSTRPDFVQGSSSSMRAADPPQVVWSSFACPPPEFVPCSSSRESATLSALDPPEHHRVGNLMTFGQWRDLIRHLLANSRRALPGVLNLYYLDNPFSRPRDGIDEEARGTAIDLALDRLTLRLVMVPPPFRPAAHVNPDSVGLLTWLYVSAAIEGIEDVDYGREDVHEALHPFLPNRPPVLELMRADPEYLIPCEFGPAVEQLEAVNTQKTNGLADLIPDLRLSVGDPGGSVDTAIEFQSEDEDDPRSLQNVRFPDPPQVVSSSFARPPPEFVPGSGSRESATLSALDPPEHHRVGNLMTFGQWRDLIRHLLANSRRALPGVLNLYYLDNPFSRPRDGIDEEARGTAIDLALDRLTLRLVMVPPPFRPAAHVNPDSVGLLTWLYVSAAIEGIEDVDYGREDVHEALHPFLPNRPPVLELMRADPEYLIPCEFGPAVEQLEAVNTQKTNGLADLIPDLRLSVGDPGGSADTAIEFQSEDEDDPRSLQNVRFPGVVRPRKRKQRPRHVDLANNPFDAAYVDPDRVPIGMEYPDRVDIPTAHR
ncbi:hypothetical protein PQX77_013724, partial [Marasmius sp. AFHP31]